MSKGGGSSPQYVPTTSTQTTKTDPWTEQQPYLKEIFKEAQTGYGDPLQWYTGEVPGVPTGQTYAPFTPETLAAMNMTTGQALNDPTVPAATGFSTGLLSGDYLSAGNPYFSNMVSNIAKTVRPQVESQFEKAGRYGSGAMDQALASSITDTAGQLAYQNYQDTMGEMGKALYLAPQTSQLGYTPAEQISGVGAMKEDQLQNAINQAMSQWQFGQMEPWQRLGLYSGQVQGGYGGTSTTQSTGNEWIQPHQANTLGNVFGGIGSLAGLGMLGYSLISSDIRSKDNVKPLDSDALSLLKGVEPVTFDYRPEFGLPGQAGFVADDLEKVMPGMVATGDDGYKRIAPFGFIPLLVRALQQQQDQIDRLKG